jgi:hypothetical protein
MEKAKRFCAVLSALMEGKTLKKKSSQLYYIKWQYDVPVIYAFIRKTDHGSILSYMVSSSLDELYPLLSEENAVIVDSSIEDIVKDE